MKYIEVHIQLAPVEQYRDLLVWALGDEGPYDSFADADDGLLAYVPASDYDPAFLQQAIDEHCAGCKVHYEARHLPDKDWNEEWEKQHSPEFVDAGGGISIWVRAPFHQHNPEATYEIEIEPKMSFGTAHHPTTRLMLGYVATTAMTGKRVLDMGCGTAVLAILAAMRGAAHVDAVDIDEWAYNNAMENTRRNSVNVCCHIGDASLLPSLSTEKYDLILANINLNILTRDMPIYAAALKQGGTLAMSGFYENDAAAIQKAAESVGLYISSRECSDGWCSIITEKH